MGIGTCILGYANKFVDTAVKKAVNSGVNSSLNSIEEILKQLNLENKAGEVRLGCLNQSL